MNFKKIIKIIVAVVLFVCLFVFSEMIYFVKSQPEKTQNKIANFAIFLSSVATRANNHDLAFDLLNFGAKSFIRENKIHYSNINYDWNDKTDRLADYRDGPIKKILSQKIPQTKGNSALVLTSNIYYNLALIAIDNSDPAKAQSYLKTAVSLHPELSFLHIELANLFLLNKDFDNAKKDLNGCLMFEYPRNHCLEYKKENLEKGNYLQAGSFSQIIPKYQGL